MIDPTSGNSGTAIHSRRHPTLAGILGALGWRTGVVVSEVSLLPAAGITREFDSVDLAPYLAVGRRDLGGETSEVSTNASMAFLRGVRQRIFLPVGPLP